MVFERLRQTKATLKVTLKGETRDRFHVDEAFREQTRSSRETATREVTLDLGKEKNEARLVFTPLIFLKLQYKDPDGVVRVFPKDFGVKAVFTPSNTEKEIKVLDDQGHLQFEAAKGQTHFTLKFDSARLRLLSHSEGVTVAEVLEDQTEQQMQDLTVANKQFFALPSKWSLVHAAWAATNVTVPKDGRVAIPAEGVGTLTVPGELTLLPKMQYVRFQFHDRRYGESDHSNKQVHIPAVVVKAARKCDETTGAPVTPIAGSHDVVSNWMLDKADNAKGCQVIAWIVTKDDAGGDLPKLDNKMVLEFGWKDGFVVSKSDTERTIEKLASDDLRRKPGKANKIYDLPAAWKSKCYYTRFTDEAQNKFFDELEEADIELSLAKATPLTFSLDDIVIVTNAGAQIAKDKDKDDNEVDFDKHTRVALLYLDHKDKYKVKVYEPRDKAAFHSKSELQKEAGTETRRNLISKYSPYTRAVVFCGSFHDVFDKRTETADFAKHQILGARAAKCEDADVSFKRIFSAESDVSSGYVHKPRVFSMHYLHYGHTDGTTVYSAVVTYYTAHLICGGEADFTALSNASKNWYFAEEKDESRGIYGPQCPGTIAEKRYAIERGFKNAMDRWNGKDYQLEQKDDEKDHLIKTFALLESKDLEDPHSPGTFVVRGGKPMCTIGLIHKTVDAEGLKISPSSAATDTTMRMRSEAFEDEGLWENDTNDPDYDGIAGAGRNAFAHELGHAAVGLWDDYITQTSIALGSFQPTRECSATPASLFTATSCRS